MDKVGSKGELLPSKSGILETGKNSYPVSNSIIKKLKQLLDQHKEPYNLGRICYHDEPSLGLIKAIHGTNVWKVEKDGGFHLDKRFGHNGRPKYDNIYITCWDRVKPKIMKSSLFTDRERFLLRGIE